MQYFESVTKAISYIEEHLLDVITADKIAERVGYSPYHFHRIFQSITRNSVSEYIRKRRLTLAAYDLFYSNLRIVEIAIKYHFTSQEAFTRAFQQRFSITPGQFRKQADMKDTPFRAMEKKALDETWLRQFHNGAALDPVIITKGRLHLAGMEIRGLHSHDIGKLWSIFRQRISELNRRKDLKSIYYSLIELAGDNWEASYTACIEIDEEVELPEGMVYKVIQPATYAVFTHKGTVARIQDTFEYIYSTWLPKSENTRMNQPEFAHYDHRYLGPMSEDSEIDIYIPIEPIA